MHFYGNSALMISIASHATIQDPSLPRVAEFASI